MKLLRNLLTRAAGAPVSRFDRYYARVLRPGVGYPTADEARRDLSRVDANQGLYPGLR